MRKDIHKIPEKNEIFHEKKNDRKIEKESRMIGKRENEESSSKK